MKRATSRRPTASETNRWVCGTVQDETSVSPHCKGTVRQIFTHPTLLSSRSGRQSVEQDTQEIRITTTHCANDSEFNAALFADMNTGCFLVPTDELILPSRRQSRRTTCPGPFSHAQVENVLELSPRGGGGEEFVFVETLVLQNEKTVLVHRRRLLTGSLAAAAAWTAISAQAKVDSVPWEENCKVMSSVLKAPAWRQPCPHGSQASRTSSPTTDGHNRLASSALDTWNMP